MVNTKLTDVTVLIDKSLSMSEQVNDTIIGFNSFLATQKDAAQRNGSHCDLQLIQFDDKYEPGPRYDVLKHPQLTREQYVPRGHSALLDAVGRTIEEAGKRYADMPEAKRPGKVVVVVLTDGADDSSQLFTAQAIREKITLQHDLYKWNFIFLGASLDAWVVGSQYGFQPGKTLSTAATSIGTQHGFAAAASLVAQAQAAVDADEALELTFTEEDIRKARAASNTASHEMRT
jgi:hypothetical protein